MQFLISAIAAQQSEDFYRTAKDAESYYARRNVTIDKFQKLIYNVYGQAVPDVFSANYKLKTGFFRRFIVQQVQYVLSNGVTFAQKETKLKLGNNFDNILQAAAKKALVDGVAFCFWNYDHLELFAFADTPNDPGFVPLYDEDSGVLKAGVRYWYRGSTKTKRFTLYEVDGYTDYIQRYGEEMEVLEGKRPYVQVIRRSMAEDEQVEAGAPYDALPIFPLYANDLRQSELVGIRESLDCYDFIKSGLANDIDDTSGFYWVLKNTGGMEDMDLQKFIERMKVVRAAVLEDGEEAEAHTLEIPTGARETMLNRLRSDLYEDAMLMDVDKALAGNQTATAIRMAYQPQDDKCGDFEYCIRDFIARLLRFIGVEDEPSFQWNRIANQGEETQMVLMAANYLDDEAILKHLPWLTPEETREILARKSAEDMTRLGVEMDIKQGGI